MGSYTNAGLYYGGAYYGGWPGFQRNYNLTKYLLGYPGYEKPAAYDYRLNPQPFLPYGYGGYGGWYTTPFGAISEAKWRQIRERRRFRRWTRHQARLPAKQSRLTHGYIL